MKSISTFFVNVIFLITFWSNSQPCNAQWQQLPEPYGGTVYCFARSGNTMFAGGRLLYSSNNYGYTWDPVTSFPGMRCNVLAECNGFLFAGSFFNLYRSADGGQTWDTLDLPISSSGIESLCHVNGTLIAMTSTIYLSDDNGETWSLPETQIPDDLNHSIFPIGQVLYVCSYFNKIYRSLDRGHHWELFTDAVHHPYAIVYANNLFIVAGWGHCHRSADGVVWDTVVCNEDLLPSCMIAVDSSNGEGQRLIMGSNVPYQGSAGMYFSDDNGETWFPIPDVNRGNEGVSCIFRQDSLWFAGTSGDGILRSTDPTASWSISNTGINEREFEWIVSGDDIIAVADWYGKGIFTSSDHGVNWQFQGITNKTDWGRIKGIAVEDGWLFAATDQGFYRKKISDSTWEVKMPDSSFLCLTSYGQILYASCYHILLKSADNGNSWQVCNQGVSLGYPHLVSAYGGTVVAVTGHGVMYSNDYGEHFSLSNTNGFWYQSWLTVNNGSSFFIATEAAGIWRSDDYGTHWEQANDTVLMYPYGIAANATEVFISTRDGGVIRSKDNGYTWTSYNEGLTGPTVNGLTLLGDTLFALGESEGGFGVVKRSAYPTGIQASAENKSGVLIIPNPATDRIRIHFPYLTSSKVHFTVSDVKGNLIQSGLIGADEDISVRDLSPGEYFISIRLHDQKVTSSFIVQ